MIDRQRLGPQFEVRACLAFEAFGFRFFLPEYCERHLNVSEISPCMRGAQLSKLNYHNPSPAEVLVLAVIRVAALLTVVCISLATCSFMLFRVLALKAGQPECEARVGAFTGSCCTCLWQRFRRRGARS